MSSAGELDATVAVAPSMPPSECQYGAIMNSLKGIVESWKAKIASVGECPEIDRQHISQINAILSMLYVRTLCGEFINGAYNVTSTSMSLSKNTMMWHLCTWKKFLIDCQKTDDCVRKVLEYIFNFRHTVGSIDYYAIHDNGIEVCYIQTHVREDPEGRDCVLWCKDSSMKTTPPVIVPGSIYVPLQVIQAFVDGTRGSTDDAFPISWEQEQCAETDKDTVFSLIRQELDRRVSELKKRLPNADDESDILGYGAIIKNALAPFLDRLGFQLMYEMKQFKKREGWKYYNVIYPFTLFHYAKRFLSEDWCDLVRNWSEGDDVVLLVMKWIFSGKWPLVEFRRLCSEIDYKQSFTVVKTQKSCFTIKEDLPYPQFSDTSHPLHCTIYLPHNVISNFILMVRKSGDGATCAGIRRTRERVGLGELKDLFRHVRPNYGDQAFICRALEQLVAEKITASFDVPTRKGTTLNTEYTTMSVWNHFNPEQQKKVVQNWVSLEPTLRTEKGLIDMMLDIFLKEIYGRKR
jgi:hypothetical protein